MRTLAWLAGSKNQMSRPLRRISLPSSREGVSRRMRLLNWPVFSEGLANTTICEVAASLDCRYSLSTTLTEKAPLGLRTSSVAASHCWALLSLVAYTAVPLHSAAADSSEALSRARRIVRVAC